MFPGRQAAAERGHGRREEGGWKQVLCLDRALEPGRVPAGSSNTHGSGGQWPVGEETAVRTRGVEKAPREGWRTGEGGVSARPFSAYAPSSPGECTPTTASAPASPPAVRVQPQWSGSHPRGSLAKYRNDSASGRLPRALLRPGVGEREGRNQGLCPPPSGQGRHRRG